MGDDSITWSAIAPDWITKNSETLKALATNPVQFIRRNVAELLVGGMVSVAFGIADVLERPFDATVAALGAAGDSFYGAAGSVGVGLSTVTALNEALLMSVATSFGPLAPAVLVALIVVEIVVALRLLLAVVVVLEELLGSVPLIGGALAGLSKALRTVFGGLPIP